MRADWYLIHEAAKAMGKIVSWPFRKTGFWFWIPEEKDVMDRWSFAHFSAAMGLFILVWSCGLSRIGAVLFANLIMDAYELAVDGRGLEDTRGASVADFGYNLMGSLFALICSLAGGI